MRAVVKIIVDAVVVLIAGLLRKTEPPAGASRQYEPLARKTHCPDLIVALAVRLLFVLLVACAPQQPAASYPVHPRLRAASGGPITLAGEVAHPGAIPYAPGITFTTALRLAGGPTALGAHAHVRRGDLFFDLPLLAIIDHEAPDPELAPGDVITIQTED